MALSEKSRNAIYRTFHHDLGEEATQEMLSYFPARDVEEPATKGDLELLRRDFANLRLDVDLRIAGLESQMHRLFDNQKTWMIGTMLTCLALAVAVVKILG